MSAQSESEPIVGLTPPVATDSSAFTQREFIDTNGKYTFRSYLTPSASGDKAAEIVGQALSSISSHQRDLSNEQLYDELHDNLCGPEPMEREQLLRFLELFIQSLSKVIDLTAEGAFPSRRNEPMEEKQTIPWVGKENKLASLTGARDFPQETRCFLKAIDLVAADSPKSGLVVKLSVFAGCSDLEISRILDTTVEKVIAKRVGVTTSIWQAYDNLLKSSGIARADSELLS